ncbi:hypothetical protein [Rhodococcus qingshengii]|uniref:hypothetical protein n=1 Tax=Rhodococcus qingshengii TaxID=334542 RepID=UPI0018DA42C2|nr:hypothetical protein [Rhodococcus qingshengii]QPG90947.1 hypothetical protein I1G86_06715 [Rhodococcus qingshengii]
MTYQLTPTARTKLALVYTTTMAGLTEDERRALVTGKPGMLDLLHSTDGENSWYTLTVDGDPFAVIPADWLEDDAQIELPKITWVEPIDGHVPDTVAEMFPDD